MPPKAKFKKEEIVEAAFAMVREKGPDALTARALGEALGSSARPVFTVFRSMEEVEEAALARANEFYEDYTRKAMKNPAYPAYKNSGMAYIRFGGEEPELFQWLFMRNRQEEKQDEENVFFDEIVALIAKESGMPLEKARLFHTEMWIFVHGAAAMAATSYMNWGEAQISNMLTDVYLGLRERFGSPVGKTED